MKCQFTVYSPVNPTEDPAKVAGCIRNIFPELKLQVEDEGVRGSGDAYDLKNLRESLEKRKIRSTARSILIKNMWGGSTSIYINKQAALIGRVNVLEEPVSALGDIKLDIRCEDIMELIDWLAPEI